MRTTSADAFVAFDNRDSFSTFSGLHGGTFATRPRANYDNVELILWHWSITCTCGSLLENALFAEKLPNINEGLARGHGVFVRHHLLESSASIDPLSHQLHNESLNISASGLSLPKPLFCW